MVVTVVIVVFFFFQAEDGIRDAQESRGLGDVYKRQGLSVLVGLTTGVVANGVVDVGVARVAVGLGSGVLVDVAVGMNSAVWVNFAATVSYAWV